VPKLLLTLTGSLSLLFCFAQKNYGVSQDYYIYQNNSSAVVPLVYYETKNHWYTAARYNYEVDQTLSLQLGKKFSKEGNFSYSLIPLAGFLAGNFKGIRIGTQIEFETGKFSLFTEPEYCLRFKNQTENFFYSWSEFSFQPRKIFYVGLAMQTTKNKNQPLTNEPGLVLGVCVKNFEIPLYFFRVSSSANYFVTGIHWRLEK
jgi:hypothetical protein